MTSEKTTIPTLIMAGGLILTAFTPAQAHNPIFTPGPHLVYNGGLEVDAGYTRKRSSGNGDKETEQESEIGFEYGLTADWTAEADISYIDKTEGGIGASGLGNVVLRSRYRFSRISTKGVQKSAALLGQIKLPTADDGSNPRLGSGSTDFMGGLLYGYESRRWYYNFAARYRLNTESGGGLEKGDKQFLDIVGGVRPFLTGYKEPDGVLFVELNFENTGRDSLNGSDVSNSGGWEVFLSPGIFATYRNIALRTGVQIPIANDLNGQQSSSDYRFKFEAKYTF